MKLQQQSADLAQGVSPPARGRGLKQAELQPLLEKLGVAPRAGAWIETRNSSCSESSATVAPRAGAWIET